MECVEVCNPLQCSLFLSVCCRPNLDLGDKLRLHKLLASATRGGVGPRATFYLVALEIPDTQSALLTEGAWAPCCKDPTRTLEQIHCNELVLEGPSLPGPLAQLPQYQHARPCQPAQRGPVQLASPPGHSSLPCLRSR